MGFYYIIKNIYTNKKFYGCGYFHTNTWDGESINIM